MGNSAQQPHDFDGAKQRLEQIAAAVENDEMPLDQALDLFEEAVALGMQVSDLIEVGLEDSVDPEEAAPEADEPALG